MSTTFKSWPKPRRSCVTRLPPWKKDLAQQKFIYVLSHDLRPVNTIINFSGVLKTRLNHQTGGLTCATAEFVHGAARASKTLGRSAPVRAPGRQTIRQEPVKLCSLVDSVVADLGDAINEPVRSLNATQAEVQGDPRLLRW